MPIRQVVLCGKCNAGEIDVGSDVLGTHCDERIAVRLVRLVAHHRAHMALGVVVLTLGKTVVQQKHSAPAQAVGQGADEGFGLGVDFGQVVVRAFNVHRRAQVGGPVGPGELVTVPHHAPLMPNPFQPHQQLHRHGVQHLVTHHHAVKTIRQCIDPTHPVAVCGQRQLLARAQAARHIDDGVALDLVAQSAKQLGRQRTGARAKLPDFVCAGGGEGVRHLHGQRLAEQRRHLGCGHKVAAGRGEGPELGGIVGVVAQAGCVQRQRHEAVKTNPAAVGDDVLANMRLQGAR